MTKSEIVLQKYEADEGMVFDWKEPRTHEEKDEEGNVTIVTDHFYAKILFPSNTDSIDNYVEVPAPIEQ